MCSWPYGACWETPSFPELQYHVRMSMTPNGLQQETKRYETSPSMDNTEILGHDSHRCLMRGLFVAGVPTLLRGDHAATVGVLCCLCLADLTWICEDARTRLGSRRGYMLIQSSWQCLERRVQETLRLAGVSDLQGVKLRQVSDNLLKGQYRDR